MSDKETPVATTESSVSQFSERELQLLGWAMQSLKSGPPDIDYDKLAKFAGMSNPRSASNAWAKIRVKLQTVGPDGAVTRTPKKPRAKKVATEGDGEDGEGTPKEVTPRKRAAKKQDVDGNASPTKKGRTKKPAEPETFK